MKRIGIIGAMEVELKLIKEKMPIIRKERISGFEFHIGTIGENTIILTCCGGGKVNAACCTQALIDKFAVDCIINTGIAGGLSPEVKVCDIVISQNVTHHDVRKSQMKTCFPYKEHFEADPEMIKLAVEACQQIRNDKWTHHLGRIVSGEAFVSDSVLKAKIVTDFSPHCVEMEGSAIGHVAYLNDVPFVVIRSISDNADDDAGITYDEFEEIAATNSAFIVLNMVKNIR